MSDIGIRFGLFELLLVLGWPGLFAGAIVGAFALCRRRIVGALAGAAIGLCVWGAVAFLARLA